MGLLDRLGETLQDMGWAIGAPAAAAFDLAMVPFDEDESLAGGTIKAFGTYLDRQFQFALGDDGGTPDDPSDDEENLFSPGINKGLEGLEWLYDNAVAQPINTANIVQRRLVTDMWGEEDGESPFDLESAWNEADEENTSIGREIAYLYSAIGGGPGLTVEGRKALDENSKIFDIASGTHDFGARFFLDPTIVLGKGAKALRASKGLAQVGRGVSSAEWFQKGGGPFASNADRTKKALGAFVDSDWSPSETQAAFRLAERADGGAIANVLVTTRDALKHQGKSREEVLDTIGLIARAGMDDPTALKPLQEKSAEAADALAALGSTHDDTLAAFDAAKTRKNEAGVRLRDTAEWVNHVRDNGGFMSEERLNALMAARKEDFFQSKEFVGLTKERLKAVAKDVRDAAREADRVEKLHSFARFEIPGRLSDSPLVASATGSTRVLQKRAGRDRLGAAGYREKRVTDLATKFGGGLGARASQMVFQNTALNLAVKAAFPQFTLGLKVADQFRSPLAPRVLKKEDPYAMTGFANFLGAAGVDPELRASLVTEFGRKVDSDAWEDVVDQGIHAALEAKVNQAAAKHNVDEKARTALLASISGELENDALRKKFHKQVFTASEIAGVPGDLIFNGKNPMPLMDTQTLKLAVLPDLHEIDHVVRRTHNYLTDMVGWATGDRAPDPNRIQQIARDSFDTVIKPPKMEKVARAAQSVNDGFWRAEEITRGVVTTATTLWKRGMLLRPAYVAKYLTDSEMRMIAKLGVTDWALHAVPGLGNAALGGAPGRISQSFAAHRDGVALTRIRAELEKAEDGARAAMKAREVGHAEETETLRASGAMESDLPMFDRQAAADEIDAEMVLPLRAAKQEVESRMLTAKEGGRKGRREAYGAFGDRRDKEVQTALGPMPSATADPYGHSLAWQIQAKTTAELAGDVFKVNYANLIADQWTTLKADAPNHMESWTHAVNAQILQSKIAKQILRNDFDTKKTLTWLRTTPEGKQLRKQMPWTTANPRAWVESVEGMILHYLPSDELLATAKASGHISSKQLERAIPADLRPPVHGESIAMTTGRGSTAVKVIDDWFNRLMTWMGDVPEDRLARHPFYRASYEQELKRRAEHMLANPYKDYYTLDEIHELGQKQAHKYAREQIKKYMYDVASTSDLSHALRFASPFVAAWEDTIRKWGRIAIEDPSIPGRLYQAWNAPAAAGFTVVDEEGKPVDKDNFDDSHYFLIQTPDWLGGKPLKMFNSHLRLPKQAVNIVLQGGLQPGFGPLVAYPVGEFSKDKPEINEFAKFINPYGPPESVWDAVAPSTLKRVQEQFDAQSGRHAADVARMYEQMVAEHRMDPTRYPKPTPALAAERAKHLGYLKILNNFVNPFPVVFDSPYKFYEDAYRAMKSEEIQQGHEHGWADQKFIEEHGETFFPLAQSASRNNAGLLANAKAVDASKKYASEIAKYGLTNGEPNSALIRMIVGIEGEDPNEQFNESAYAWQQQNMLAPGANVPFRDKKNYLEASADADSKLGWYKFRQFMSTMDAMANERGLETYKDDPELVETRKQFIENLKQQLPAWEVDYSQFDAGRFERDLTAVGELAGSGTFMDQPMRTDMAGVRQYLQLRGEFLAEMRELDISPTSEDAALYREEFTAEVSRLVSQNTQFAEFAYYPYLERDPLLSEVE